MSQARTGILKRELYRQIANLCSVPLALIVWFVVNAILIVAYMESQLGGPLGALVGLIIGVKQEIVKNRKTFMLFRNIYGSDRHWARKQGTGSNYNSGKKTISLHVTPLDKEVYNIPTPPMIEDWRQKEVGLQLNKGNVSGNSQLTPVYKETLPKKNSRVAPIPPPTTTMYNDSSSSPSSSLLSAISLEPGVKSYPLFDFGSIDDSYD